MKLILIFSLLTLSAHAALTPPKMKYGYWEYKTDLGANPMIKKAIAQLSKLPKAQRDQIIKRMGGSKGFKTLYKCHREKDKKKFEKMMSDAKDTDGCKMIVKRSTSRIYEAERKCSDNKKNIQLSFKMDNEKRGSSIIKMASTNHIIKNEFKWISKNCPKRK